MKKNANETSESFQFFSEQAIQTLEKSYKSKIEYYLKDLDKEIIKSPLDMYKVVISYTEYVLSDFIKSDEIKLLSKLSFLTTNDYFPSGISNAMKNQLRICFLQLETSINTDYDLFVNDFSPLFCHHYLLQRIPNILAKLGRKKYFSENEEFILLKFIMEYALERKLDKKEYDLLSQYFDLYINSKTAKDILKNNEYKYIPSRIDYEILHIDLAFCTYYIGVRPLNQTIQNQDSDNILFDILHQPLYDMAIYQLIHDYTESDLTYYSFITQHIQNISFDFQSEVSARSVATTPKMIENIQSEVSHILSGNFSKYVNTNDVTGMYSYYSTVSSAEYNIHRSRFLRPLNEDLRYFDLLYLSKLSREGLCDKEIAQELSAIISDEISDNIHTNIFPADTQENKTERISYIRQYIKLLKSHKCNFEKINRRFIDTINKCIKYLTPHVQVTLFERITFNNNPIVYEWNYLSTITKLYKSKDPMYNEFLISLKQIPFYQIRYMLLQNIHIFYPMFANSPDFIKQYKRIIDIVYKIISTIIQTILGLPLHPAQEQSSSIYKIAAEKRNTLLNLLEYKNNTGIPKAFLYTLDVEENKIQALKSLLRLEDAMFNQSVATANTDKYIK